jgi:transcriptional regulator with XRE-family HTH domain
MPDEPNPLGEYVRARRELVTPEQVGIPVIGVRRVPGLRREEVAMLAGISADYYLRLEQGRDRNPSAQVLESIARVLQLDADATAHLLLLGADRPRRHRAKSRPRKETVPPGIAKLVVTLPLPALVEGRYFDVLAANSLATALSPRFTEGANRLRSLFLDPAEQALSLASPLFSRLWARHDVLACEAAPKYIDHPQVGGLRLNRERLSIDGAAGQTLVVYHPDPGTDSADRLALLASAVQTPAAGAGSV